MRRYLILVLFILTALFLQLIFSSQINPLRIKPDFLLMVLIFLNFYIDFKEAVVLALFAGFLKDSFSAGVFSASIFLYLICTILIAQYKNYIYREDLSLKIALVLVLSLINGFLYYLIILSRISIPFFRSLFFIILPESLYTVVLSPLVFWVMRRCALKYSI